MKNFLKNKFFFLVLAALLFLAAYFLCHPFVDGASPTISDFEQILHKKEKRLNDEMLSLAKRAETQNYFQLFAEKPDDYNTLLEQEGLVLMIYENDTLKFWSDNSIAVENWIKEVCLDTKMVKLHNGWFEVMKPNTNSSTTKTIVGLILIKNEYPYQNKYLVNEFQKDFAVPTETKLIVNFPNATNQVKNLNQEYLFSLEFNSANNSVVLHSYFALVFNLLGFFFIILFLKKTFLSVQTRIGNNTALVLFALSVLLLRYFTIKFSIPEIFYDFELFSPKIYADASSVWLTSLGDLMINTVLLFFLTYLILKEYKIEGVLTRLKKINRLVFLLLMFLAFFWFSWIITSLFSGLIKNSNIPFSINNLFSLNQYSYIALVIIGLLLFIYFLCADKIVSVLKQFQLNKKQYVLVFIISAIVHSAVLHLLGILDLIIVFWPFVLIIVIAIIKQKQTIYSFSGIVFLIFLFSLYAMHIFVKHTSIKEIESRKVYAEKLVAEQDPVAEFLFHDIEKELINDSILISYINGAEKQTEKFEKRLKQVYFSGFWEKYDIRIALFDSFCMPVIKSQNALFDNNLYFDELIEKKSIPTSCEHFSFLNNASGKISYLAKFPLSKSIVIKDFGTDQGKTKLGTLYIELDAKFISDEIGFPELLLDRNVGLSQELSNYSYAKYKYDQLISQYGKFQYDLSVLDFNNNVGGFSILTKEKFNHLLYRPDRDTLIVLSKQKEGIIDQITTFSYLFAFFSLLLLLISFADQVFGGTPFKSFSFKYRIQLFLVFIVLTSLALFGGGTIYYIKQQFETKNRENISEKIHSILMEMESKFIEEKELSNDMSEYMSFTLKKFSNVFFTDINLYDTKGNLYASSRPKVFDEGLTSKKMDPEAFLQIAVFGKTEYIHDERIGKLEYLSAYIPFKNKDGKSLSYLNLPYFAKQNELEKEISGFLVALINIYVLLFALSIVTAIIISNYVTKPLKLIQDKLSKIKLGKTNELIEWQEMDEIGSLVSEYNRMIIELTKSAELLAKSERESAWREMAKQVAHEIKNPLTPMKLSIQHLQRIWKDDAPDMDQKVERLTQTIIEQIDTLSSIATEFSNFAKMPKANLEQINVQEVLLNSIALFQDSENIHITFENKTSDNAIVLMDKEQLLRVFNNLLKNAIQAIPEERKGEIEIGLKEENEFYIISIKDNGIGINEDALDKIFVPNFTTKTGGMGLGLAMVKSIIESSNGKISFETNPPEGSTFFVAIPAIFNN
ncbi:MAG: HAMP domain-containing histidine kinase [Bacteroidetes bacterium]|nr:HAMP domain-containing histidine kinase [Bacteroidota bacterium]